MTVLMTRGKIERPASSGDLKLLEQQLQFEPGSLQTQPIGPRRTVKTDRVVLELQGAII